MITLVRRGFRLIIAKLKTIGHTHRYVDGAGDDHPFCVVCGAYR